ncbi:hypothetical protein ACHQM5_020901 [Ranunculus cassubicifolius]
MKSISPPPHPNNPFDTMFTEKRTKDEIQDHNNALVVQLLIVKRILIGPGILSRRVLSLYQGLGKKNLQSFISYFMYFYGYSYFKRMYIGWSGKKDIGTKANLVIAAAAGACTVIVIHPLDTVSSRMQTSAFGKSKGLLQSFKDNTWSEAYDGLGISLLLTSNPSIQEYKKCTCRSLWFIRIILRRFPFHFRISFCCRFFAALAYFSSGLSLPNSF